MEVTFPTSQCSKFWLKSATPLTTKPENRDVISVMPLVQVNAIWGSCMSLSIIASSCSRLCLVKVFDSPLIVKVPESPKLAFGHRQVTPLVCNVKSGFEFAATKNY